MDLPRTGANGHEKLKTADDPVARIVKVIREGERFLVCSHAGPDGDAVGSMLAMGTLLEAMGKRADLVIADRIPDIYRGLPGVEGIRTAMRVHGPYDAAILLECDGPARTQLQGLEKFRQHRSPCERDRICAHQLDRYSCGLRGPDGASAISGCRSRGHA